MHGTLRYRCHRYIKNVKKTALLFNLMRILCIFALKFLVRMSKNVINYLVFHYELMNDLRYLLIFEPNVFQVKEDAIFHGRALSYLSGNNFYVVPESDINKLPLIDDGNDDFIDIEKYCI